MREFHQSLTHSPEEKKIWHIKYVQYLLSHADCKIFFQRKKKEKIEIIIRLQKNFMKTPTRHIRITWVIYIPISQIYVYKKESLLKL